MGAINAKTTVCGIIGNPVKHSLSPFVQNTLSELTGINSVYAAFPVERSLKKAIEGAHELKIMGMNVTSPYKKDVIPLLHEIDENARRIGAVNTLKYTADGYKGYNTDFFGVLRTFERYNITFDNVTPLIVGAGGGACACAFAAAEHGAKQIFIVNRTNINSESLATNIKRYYNIEIKTFGYDELSSLNDDYFIFQTTSVGMGSNDSPIGDLSVIGKSCGVFDMIYSPLKTKILSDAESFGKLAVNGLDMLVFQAVSSFEIWNGIKVEDGCISVLLERFMKYLN